MNCPKCKKDLYKNSKFEENMPHIGWYCASCNKWTQCVSRNDIEEKRSVYGLPNEGSMLDFALKEAKQNKKK